MAGFRRPPLGRTAMMVTLIALLAIVCISVYLFLVRRLHSASPLLQAPEITRETLRRELSVLLVVMLGSVLLILLFVIGAYLLIRVGRAVSQKGVGGQPTEYTDAWSRYRLSQEEIEAATREERSDPRSQPPPDADGQPEPPSDEPENPGPR
jgi:hypothetical protein